MVFQQFNLFPHLTVLENCTLAPIWVRKMPKREAEEVALHYLTRVKIPEQAAQISRASSPAVSSSASRSRARLCMNPKIMLFDEPTSALDPEMVKEVLDTMVELAEDGMTMLVRHARDGLCPPGRRTASSSWTRAQIVEANAPEEFFAHPQHERTKLFLSQILH